MIWKTYSFFNPDYENSFVQNVQELQDRRIELNEIVNLATEEISSQNIPNNGMDLDDVSYELRDKMENLGFRSFRFELINNCDKKYRFFFQRLGRLESR
jgi:hypothetical protein